MEPNPTLRRGELDVTPTPRQQELISKNAMLNKYEGASEVTGTLGGTPVTGNGYVEMVGRFE